MKSKIRNSRFEIALFILLAALVLGGPLRAQEQATAGQGDPMEGLREMPQAQGNLPPTPLSSAQEERVLGAVFARYPNVDQSLMMEYIRQHFPGELQEFTLMSMQNLGGAIDFLIHLVGDCLELQGIERRDPDLYALRVRHLELERRARELGEAIAYLNGAEREARVTELRQALVDAFGVKQELMRRDLAGIRQQVKELDELVNRRDANREAIIERRVADMTEPGNAAAW